MKSLSELRADVDDIDEVEVWGWIGYDPTSRRWMRDYRDLARNILAQHGWTDWEPGA